VRDARILVFVAAVAAIPRLIVLAYARGTILTEYVEKSDTFARTFIASGTYGFVPGVPSAYTQPLYGWFLIPLYWIDRTWVLVGLAQIAVACCTALVVLQAGTLALGRRTGVIGAVLATLNPYLIWHDVHINREILDQLLAAALFLAIYAAARAGGWALAGGAGALLGLAILGNSRLAALPLALAAYVLFYRRNRGGLVFVGVMWAAALVVMAPWAIRNKTEVGCWAITTDAHALWKANNTNTYRTLARGGWIDDVPAMPGVSPITPEYETDFYEQGHRIVRVNECKQEHTYEHAVFVFWRRHPGEKLKLMAQATRMLWQPQQTRTEGGPETVAGIRSWAEAVWTLPIYLFALIGLFLVPRRFAGLALVFLAYETFEAWIFAGATRYRISFDFVLALLAAATVTRLLNSWRYTASTPSTAAPSEN